MKHVVEGFPEQCPPEKRLELRRRMHEDIDLRIGAVRQQIEEAADPLRALFQRGVDFYTFSAQVEGFEHIPKDSKVVVAFNHPFPFVDDFLLMNNVAECLPDRPWAFVGNVASISRYFPRWRSQPSFAHRVIPVEREEGNSFGRVTNGAEVVRSSIQFLRMHKRPILFIAPEGSDAMFEDRIGEPHAGFARIAREADAQIVPVLCRGSGDLEELKFGVHEEILPPFWPSKNQATTAQEWHHLITQAL